jgi:hypothetical protein
MNRSTDIRSSIPTEQCLAMARVSSDWTWNGGNTPVMNPHPGDERRAILLWLDCTTHSCLKQHEISTTPKPHSN